MRPLLHLDRRAASLLLSLNRPETGRADDRITQQCLGHPQQLARSVHGMLAY